MASYTNILLAVDLRVTHDTYTISKAAQLSKENKATLNIIHVMEPIYSYGAAPGSAFVEMEKRIAEDARKAFEDLTSDYDFLPSQFLLEVGSPSTTVVAVAQKLKADLIIVGAHSKHGLQKLLGSTANGIINHAHCDVLTVRTTE